MSCGLLACCGAGLLYVAWRNESFPRVPCAGGGDDDDLDAALARDLGPGGRIPMPTHRSASGSVDIQGGIV